MIENLEKLLLKKYNYSLDTYKVSNEEIKKSKIIIPSLIIFLLIVIGYFAFEFIDLIVLGFALFILVLIPVALKKGERYNIIVVTPEMLIQQVTKKEVVAISFDKIKKFSTNKQGVVIKDAKSTIILDPHSVVEDMLVIIEILEAKGKTFDKTKDYMIRKIEVVIKNDVISIKDIIEEETTTEKIVSENYKKYAMLTPGFITDIILMNSVIEGSHKEKGNLFIKLSSFEVNPGHPENTQFDSQVANDCIMIFEDVKMESIVKKEARGTNEEVIEASIENLIEEIHKGVISDWKYKKGSIELQFSVGLLIIRTSFKYKEVIIGWNKFN